MNDIGGIIASLEQQRAAIERALAALREVSGGAAPAAKRGPGRPPKSGAKPKRVLSPEGRARIIAATKRRWAAVRKAQGLAPKKQTAKKKRAGLTAEGRARLSALMKARWASGNPPKKVAKKS